MSQTKRPLDSSVKMSQTKRPLDSSKERVYVLHGVI